MTSKKNQHKKHSTATEFEARKKAFHAAMEKTQHQIAAAAGEIRKLRTDMETQTAQARDKTMIQLERASKLLDAARKQQQQVIEEHLKAVHTDLEAAEAEATHATAAARMAAEAKARELREEYDSTRHALITSIEGELAEWKSRVDQALLHVAAEKKADLNAGVQAKIADLHAKHDAAEKSLDSLKQASVVAFRELHRGLNTAITELETAFQHALTDVASASGKTHHGRA